MKETGEVRFSVFRLYRLPHRRRQRGGGADPRLVVGPTWKGLWGSRRELSDGTIVKKVDAAYLRESILDPGARVPKGFEGLGVGMPSYLGILKDWQIEALILYMESVKE